MVDVVGCDGKEGFVSRTIADRAASRRTNRQVYRCHICHRWHVGTSKGKRSKPRQRKPWRR